MIELHKLIFFLFFWHILFLVIKIVGQIACWYIRKLLQLLQWWIRLNFFFYKICQRYIIFFKFLLLFFFNILLINKFYNIYYFLWIMHIYYFLWIMLYNCIIILWKKFKRINIGSFSELILNCIYLNFDFWVKLILYVRYFLIKFRFKNI